MDDVVAILDRNGYELEVEDTFDAPELDDRLWFPAYLPHWSSTPQAAARYDVGGGSLRLRIEADQQPWCPEFDGQLRVSSLQTGLSSRDPSAARPGSIASAMASWSARRSRHGALYTPTYGLFEVRARALDDPRTWWRCG